MLDTLRSVDSQLDAHQVDEVILSNAENLDEYVPLLLVAPVFKGLGKTERPLLALLDTGSDTSWISRTSLPPKAPLVKVSAVSGQTLTGEFVSDEAVFCFNTKFPELSNSLSVTRFAARVFSGKCRYDIIIGRDLMKQMGLDLKFSENVISWRGKTCPMRPRSALQDASKREIREQLFLNLRLVNDVPLYEADSFATCGTEIKDSKY